MFSIELSRAISFLIAVFTTWILNRTFTFTNSNLFSKKKEYFRYLIIQTVGALLNYFIFINLVYYFAIFESYLILPLSIASIFAMFFNYFFIKKTIYSN